MDYSSLRAEARKRLAGKWKEVILILIVTGLVSGLIGSIPNFTKTRETVSLYGYAYYTTTKDNPVSVILTLAATVVTTVLSFGMLMAYWKIWKGEDAGAADGVKLAIANWKRALFILINMIKKLLIPVIIVVAAMLLSSIFSNGFISVVCVIALFIGSIWLIIAGLHYALSYIVAIDDPNLSEEAAVERSKELMTNRRGKYVVLYLTFIGWILLGAITLGIGLLWVTPYIQFACFAFYEYCKGSSNSTPAPEVKEEDNGPIQEG